MNAEREAMLALLRERGIGDERVLAAMAAVPREEFVPDSERIEAYDDRALGIGHDQTISQPLMVATLVSALELRQGDHALDVGTGSGYQAAVMAACGAQVVGIERIPELAEAAAERLRRLGFEIAVICGDGSLGLPDWAPFDAIAVAATAPRVPPALARQLADGGRLVMPLHVGPEQDELIRMRNRGGRWESDDLGPCRFVPLIGGDGFPLA